METSIFNQHVELVHEKSQQDAIRGWAGGGVNSQASAPQIIKGSWNAQEDATLREMISIHGEGNWAAIAEGLPGRTRKQCYERWTNNLRPEIKQRSLWTEEEDRDFVEAHKLHGNRWSAIARCLKSGRSQNSVKNHWNATMRSLGAKRWIKNKRSGQQVAFGQVTLLEEYILSLQETFTESELLGEPGHEEFQAIPNTVNLTEGPAPRPDQVMQGEVAHQNASAPSDSCNPQEIGSYTDPTSLNVMQGTQEYDDNAFNDLDVNYDLPFFMDDVNFAFELDVSSPDPQRINTDSSCPLSENVGWQPTNEGTSNEFCNEGAPNSIGDNVASDDINDAFQLASMEIYSPEYDINFDDPTQYI